ncbi:MAG: CRISPR-associated endonuclease Cas2 [Bacteroidia bacterium]
MAQINLYLVTYDISSDRDRTRCSNLLEDMGGRRVNKSVFEVLVPPEDVEGLMVYLSELLDPETDAVACYPVCTACYSRAWWWPEAPGPWPEAITTI